MSWSNQLPSPTQITGTDTSTLAVSALQAKYADSANWATWAATLMESMTSSIQSAVSEDMVASNIVAVTTAIGNVPVFNPGSLGFTNDVFTDSLLTKLRTRLELDVEEYHTGLGSSVEAAMFDRARDRVTAERALAYTEITSFYGDRGFDMPPGALIAKQTEMTNESSRRLTDINRDILHETAVLAAQYNLEMLKICEQLVDIVGRFNDSRLLREFEIKKTSVLQTLDAYKAQLAMYEVKGTLLEKEAQLVIESLQRAMTVEVEAFKGVAQSAAQMVASALNGVSVSSAFGFSGSENHSFDQTKSNLVRQVVYQVSGKMGTEVTGTPPTT